MAASTTPCGLYIVFALLPRLLLSGRFFIYCSVSLEALLFFRLLRREFRNRQV